jgi:hypothetical protein
VLIELEGKRVPGTFCSAEACFAGFGSKRFLAHFAVSLICLFGLKLSMLLS